MKKKLSSFAAGELAHPEIKHSGNWKGKIRDLVTVKTCLFFMVTFCRGGYSSPCIQPDLRFLTEFLPVNEVKP